MESTINMIGAVDPEEAKRLVAQGIVKRTEEGVPYLCIETNESEKE